MRNRRIQIICGLTALLIILSIGIWCLMQETGDSIVNEMAELAPRLLSPNVSIDGEHLLEAIAKIDIRRATIPDTTFLISRLLTNERTSLDRNLPHVPPPAHGPAWIEYKKKAPPNVQARMSKWESYEMRFPVTSYIFGLYEKNYGTTRTSLNFLLQYKNRLPFLHLLIARAIFEKTGRELPFVYFEPPTKETKAAIRDLFNDNTLITWAQSVKVNLKHFGGLTNTAIGMYDWIAYPQYAEKTGFHEFPKHADAYFDYGGGFATPDISHLIGKKFTSVDIVAPQLARSMEGRFFVLKDWYLPSVLIKTLIPQTPSDREVYLQELDQTPWLKYDIFTDSLPTNYNSYFITSFGFLSSTIQSISSFAPYRRLPQIPARISTNYVATRRIIELVALGKDVDVFTYERASARLYRYRSVFLSFRNHRLVKSVVMPVDTEGPPGVLRHSAL